MDFRINLIRHQILEGQLTEKMTENAVTCPVGEKKSTSCFKEALSGLSPTINHKKSSVQMHTMKCDQKGKLHHTNFINIALCIYLRFEIYHKSIKF